MLIKLDNGFEIEIPVILDNLVKIYGDKALPYLMELIIQKVIKLTVKKVATEYHESVYCFFGEGEYSKDAKDLLQKIESVTKKYCPEFFSIKEDEKC